MNLKNQSRVATLYLMAVAIALSIFLRLTHLDTKISSFDEVFTALRVSGYTEAELVTDLSNPVRPVDIQYLQKYQRPNSEKTVLNTITGLAQEEPQLAPLYYIIIKLWADFAGGSMAMLRSGSAVISLLAFPCIYWLGLELFNSRLTASIATVLLAASPYYLMYSQDARHYSLWAVCILFSSAVLLKVSRSGSKIGWIIYALSFTVSLYTVLISGIVGIGHLIYTVGVSKGRPSKVLSHLLALTAGLAAFAPWIVVVIENSSQVKKMSGQVPSEKLSIFELARGWVRLPGKLLYELNQPSDAPFPEKIFQYFLTVFCIVFVLYALYILCRTTGKEVWLFVLTLIGTTGFGLVVQDLTLGGHSGTGGMSNLIRYLVPCFLGLILAIAHLFSFQITHSPSWKHRLWQGGLTVFVATQIILSLSIWQAPIASVNGKLELIQMNVAALKAINQTESPLLVTDSSAWEVMYLIQNLKPSAQILTRPFCTSCNLDINPTAFVPAPTQTLDQYPNIFLYPNPSEAVLDWAKQQTAFQLKETLLLPNQATKLISLDRI
ncbi:MAG: glycosyltransferase family 39 protein [Timaviella obliquedivisa GSE-PSE-MK23-08B]|jgi:uncharacterized membrane protein|nr:glycosyltransferase family 39 protein [Timaviella obliquedivisa GSE-PSE-MK23-08B]